MGQPHPSAHHLDLRGYATATDIVARAINRFDAMQPGETLSLTVDAGEAIDNDVRAWTEAIGHHLLDVVDGGSHRTYVIEKGVPVSVVHRLALVISSHGDSHLEAPLSLALAAALEGVDVSVFFEGPAVRMLTRAGGGSRRRWPRLARRRVEAIAHNRVHEIARLGGHIYACERALHEYAVASEDLAVPDIVRAEYLTFLPVMEAADIQLLA